MYLALAQSKLSLSVVCPNVCIHAYACTFVTDVFIWDDSAGATLQGHQEVA